MMAASTMEGTGSSEVRTKALAFHFQCWHCFSLDVRRMSHCGAMEMEGVGLRGLIPDTS